MKNYWVLLICISVAGITIGSGCSSPISAASAGSSTAENISVSQQVRNGSCVAAVTVQESVNGKKHTLHQANVPCGNIGTVQGTLVAQAKQGL